VQVIELTQPLPFLLLFNSFITITLIFNQNESAKDSISLQNTTASSNPIEQLTWITLIIQFCLLLIKIKTTDF
jgi:hypothetical protein